VVGSIRASVYVYTLVRPMLLNEFFTHLCAQRYGRACGEPRHEMFGKAIVVLG